MAKGFTDKNGKFHPTGRSGSSRGKFEKSTTPEGTDQKIIREIFEAQQSQGDRLVDQIRHGDKVTIVTPNGQQVTGSAVMKSALGDNSWVLNTGGEHGERGAIASDDNVIRVVEG